MLHDLIKDKETIQHSRERLKVVMLRRSHESTVSQQQNVQSSLDCQRPTSNKPGPYTVIDCGI